MQKHLPAQVRGLLWKVSKADLCQELLVDQDTMLTCVVSAEFSVKATCKVSLHEAEHGTVQAAKLLS